MAQQVLKGLKAIKKAHTDNITDILNQNNINVFGDKGKKQSYYIG